MRELKQFTVDINDIQMHCQSSDNGKPLLLLHGFTGSSADWSLIFKDVPSGFSVLVPDLRGHGKSSNPSGEFSFKQCAADIIALLDHLGLKEIVAIGLSGGAQVLLHVAVAQPERISKLVLVSTAHYFPDTARAIMNAHTFDTVSVSELEQLRKKHIGGDKQIKTLYTIGRSFKDSYDDVNFTEQDLAMIQSKTLIVHGDNDPLYPVTVAVDMFNAIPNAKLWVIPDAGHLPVFFEEVAVFRDRVFSFLKPSAK